MVTDELMLKLSNESISELTSPDLQLQKRLAKLILDLKYDNELSQTSIDMLLGRFRAFFHESIVMFSNNVRFITDII